MICHIHRILNKITSKYLIRNFGGCRQGATFKDLTEKKAVKKNPTFKAGHLWLTPVILATQEAEIRRIVF
jgi:hypothetical protein